MQNKKRLILITGVSLLAVIAIAVIVFFVAFNDKSYRIIKLEDYSGSVEVLRKNNLIELFNGLQLVSGDSSAIGDDSLMLLLIDSDKHMMVSENTKFNVRATGTEENGKVVIDITDGRASFAIDNKLGEDSVFEVHTPNATTSIRGTVFNVSYDPSNDQTVVAVNEGVVDVESVSGERVTLTEEETAFVTGDSVTITKSDIMYFFRIETFGDSPRPRYSKYTGTHTGINGYESGVYAELSTDYLNELYYNVMSDHRDEIDAYEKETVFSIYETYGEKGMTNDEYSRIAYESKNINITYWFPEELVMDAGDGFKTYKIDRVDYSVSSVKYNPSGQRTSEFIELDDGYWVRFDPLFRFYIHEVDEG